MEYFRVFSTCTTFRTFHNKTLLTDKELTKDTDKKTSRQVKSNTDNNDPSTKPAIIDPTREDVEKRPNTLRELTKQQTISITFLKMG